MIAPSSKHLLMYNGEHMHQHAYRKLALMAALSFIAMYILMYAMVNRFDNVLHNVNQFYMAGLMTAPMIVIELVLMRRMYDNRKLNILTGAIAVIGGIGFFTAVRTQAGVGDVQFLRSMIPHHASAILMCENASIQSPEVVDLCRAIVSSQQSEIEQMKGLLGGSSK